MTDNAPKPEMPFADDADLMANDEPGGAESEKGKPDLTELDAPHFYRMPPRIFNKNAQSQQWITNRLTQYRAQQWEEDISRNTDDCEPFKNLKPISERDRTSFNNRPNQIPDELLGDHDFWGMVEKDNYPIPSPEDRENYSVGFDNSYWMFGLADFLKIMEVAKSLKVDIKSYLDFGSASGRVVRHFAIQSDVPEIWASDINGRHIRWMYEFMPMNVKPIFNHCIPSLPIPDASLDVVSAFSVFTHIDTFETCWMAELSRILKPSGFAYITVHNEDTWETLRESADDPNNRLLESIRNINPRVMDQLAKPMPKTRLIYRFAEQGAYRAQVFHSNDYIRQVWGRFFKVERIIPLHHIRQSVVILTKR